MSTPFLRHQNYVENEDLDLSRKRETGLSICLENQPERD